MEATVSARTRAFVALTNDSNVGAAFDVDTDSDTMLIAFGGMPGHIGMPVFEFFTLTKDLAIKKVYLRDLARAWYLAGIPGFGDDVPSTAEALRNTIEKIGAKRVVMAGNSSGGWAALLFGALAGADLVLAFAPQTVLLADQLHAVEDTRWDAQLRRLTKREMVDERFLDLVPVLSSPDRPRPVNFVVHYPSDYALDTFHAERLGGREGVELVGYPGVRNHGLIRKLRRTGQLGDILEAAVRQAQPASSVQGHP
jgi:hypothetical protein